jgi:hypothetical protein
MEFLVRGLEGFAHNTRRVIVERAVTWFEKRSNRRHDTRPLPWNNDTPRQLRRLEAFAYFSSLSVSGCGCCCCCATGWGTTAGGVPL